MREPGKCYNLFKGKIMNQIVYGKKICWHKLTNGHETGFFLRQRGGKATEPPLEQNLFSMCIEKNYFTVLSVSYL